MEAAQDENESGFSVSGLRSEQFQSAQCAEAARVQISQGAKAGGKFVSG